MGRNKTVRLPCVMLRFQSAEKPSVDCVDGVRDRFKIRCTRSCRVPCALDFSVRYVTRAPGFRREILNILKFQIKVRAVMLRYA